MARSNMPCRRTREAQPGRSARPDAVYPRDRPEIRVDPEVALRVAKSEGLRDFSGDGGKSGWRVPALYRRRARQQIQEGHRARPARSGQREGNDRLRAETRRPRPAGARGMARRKPASASLTGSAEAQAAKADPAAGYGGIGSDAAASERAATAIKGTDTDTSTPETGVSTSPAATGAATGDWLDKLKDPRGNANAGLGEAITGLGQAVTGSGAKNMYTTPPPQPVPVAMPAAPVTPMVNPQAVNQQRQQLASAMQRLNSESCTEMAIFASTTLGTSDPSKAMNIKVLEARAQALAAAQAKQEVPTSMPSPWQGASHVFNQAADAFATKRADRQAAQQRQELAALHKSDRARGPEPAAVGRDHRARSGTRQTVRDAGVHGAAERRRCPGPQGGCRRGGQDRRGCGGRARRAGAGAATDGRRQDRGKRAGWPADAGAGCGRACEGFRTQSHRDQGARRSGKRAYRSAVVRQFRSLKPRTWSIPASTTERVRLIRASTAKV